MTLQEELSKAVAQKVDFDILVPAAQAGNKAAQDALMASFYAWSVSEARRVVRDTERAKDIAVDFWSWLFKDKGVLEYDAARGAFYPWMAAQLRYRALAALGEKQPKVVYYSEVSDPNTWSPDPAVRVGALQDLEAVAADLKSGQHKDVFWRLIEGVTPQEIADELGISIKRARNLIGEVRAVIVRHTGESDG